MCILLAFFAALVFPALACCSARLRPVFYAPMGIVLALCFVTPVAGGTLEDAAAARERGDYGIALRLYNSLSDQGEAAAQAMLGIMYEHGEGVPQNYSEAAYWYRLAAEQSHAPAAGLLGLLHEEGRGVPQSYADAAKWYRLAAEQGDDIAQAKLGGMFLKGQGVPQNHAEATKWFRLAAENGNASAQVWLGLMFYQGRGVTQNYAEAEKWYRLAAEQGDANAQALLGGLYFDGKGVPQSYAEATKWMRLAAEQGRVTAQVMLASIYYKVNDYAQAAKWYGLAAVQGDASAENALGALYYSGRGVPQNYVAAYMWFSLAAAQGYQDALRLRDEIRRMMSPVQVAEAQKQASEWRPKKPNAALAKAAPRSHPSENRYSAAISGTAFFVSSDGKMLTNAHVAQKCQQIRVAGAVARLLARDDVNDLALLASDQHPLQWANWRQTIKQGEEIVAYGFPLAGVLSSSGNVVTGNVTALAGVGDDSRYLQISAPVQPGNSGGPLFDRNGNVVGVVVAKLDAMSMASATGDIPQNVNFAIKASAAVAFLDAQRVPRFEGATGDPPVTLSTPAIAAHAQSLTMQVICLQ